jgi:Fe-S-cluster containining protein
MDEVEQLARTVRAAATRPEVRHAVIRLYAAVQKQIDARRPLCVISGRCCRFEEYGHRLYVTTIELAAFTHDLENRPPNPPAKGLTQYPAIARAQGQLPQATNPGGCPFQSGKLCGVHSIRPFGCRMFFCDATAVEWQNQAYERFHAELKTLHEQLSVPYHYLEWRSALSALGL